MPLDATVVVCTYNGAKRLPFVLEMLKGQSCPAERWDLLVVDNASIDKTGEIAERFIQEKLGGHGCVVREPQLGLSFARARAARIAQGQIICFLDDDNIPEPDFVKNAVQAFEEFPTAGAIGGKVLPVWETKAGALALAVQDFSLAICDRGDKAFKYARYVVPVGAGLCIRAEALAQIYRDEKNVASVVGRTGNGFGGGEDVAIAVLVWQAGWECWYEPALVIRHLLSARRMEKDYLLRLHDGIGRGQFAVRKLYDWKARTPLAWLIGIKDFCRWLLGKWRGPSPELRGQHPEIAGDLHELSQSLTLGRARQALSWPL